MSGFRKPLKTEQAEIEFPSVDQYKGQFTHDLQAWEHVFDQFPEDVQLSVEGLLLKIEDSEHVDPKLLRQLSTIFAGNAKDEVGQRLGKWFKIMGDFADFYPEAVDKIIDIAVGGDEDSEEPEPEK